VKGRAWHLLRSDPLQRFIMTTPPEGGGGGVTTRQAVQELHQEPHKLKLLAYLRAQGNPVPWLTVDSAVPRYANFIPEDN
jgi:hypothetical protein